MEVEFRMSEFPVSTVAPARSFGTPKIFETRDGALTRPGLARLPTIKMSSIERTEPKSDERAGAG